MKYSWVVFDADDTLFHFDGYKGLVRAFAEFGVTFTGDDFVAHQAVSKPLWQAYQNGKISASELKNQRFAPWAKKLGVSAEVINGRYMAAMAESCPFVSGAQALLQALSACENVKLGIITNGFIELQAPRLAYLDLSSTFDFIAISEQLGFAKPHHRIFDYALEQMGNPPKSEVLMVGDNLYSDVLGGELVGLDTCWLNEQGVEGDTNIHPTYEVRSLSELHDILFSKVTS